LSAIFARLRQVTAKRCM